MRFLYNLIPLALLLPLIGAQTTTTVLSPAILAETASPLPWPLGNHPFLLSELDDLCNEYHRLDYLLNHMNKTAFQHAHPYFNLTILPEILANASAEITAFSQNKTLIRLCKRAEEIEKDCYPLVGGGWKYIKGKTVTEWVINSTYANGTDTNVTEVEIAKKNATLVIICDKWIKGITDKNKSRTDAALDVEDDSTSTSTANTTGATTSTTGAAATGTTSASVPRASLSDGLIACAVIILAGMVMLG